MDCHNNSERKKQIAKHEFSDSVMKKYKTASSKIVSGVTTKNYIAALVDVAYINSFVLSVFFKSISDAQIVCNQEIIKTKRTFDRWPHDDIIKLYETTIPYELKYWLKNAIKKHYPNFIVKEFEPQQSKSKEISMESYQPMRDTTITKSPMEKFLYLRDGERTATVVRRLNGDGTLSFAWSISHEVDNFSKKKGKAIAVARLHDAEQSVCSRKKNVYYKFTLTDTQKKPIEQILSFISKDGRFLFPNCLVKMAEKRLDEILESNEIHF